MIQTFKDLTHPLDLVCKSRVAKLSNRNIFDGT